jgi:two-component sensor histidine kinase
MKIIFTCFLLSLISFTILGQAKDTAAIKELLKTKYTKALELHKNKNFDESFVVIKEIYQLSDDIGQYNPKFTAQNLRASALLQNMQYDLLDHHYEEMEKQLKKAKPHLQCFYWFNKAQYLFETNRITDAEKHANIGIKILEKSFADYCTLFIGYCKLNANIHERKKSYNLSRSYLSTLEDSLQSATFNCKDKKEYLYDLYNTLGNFSKNINDITLAEYYYAKALSFNGKTKEQNMIRYNLALLKSKKNDVIGSNQLLDSLHDTDLYASTKVRKYFTKCMNYEKLNDAKKYIESYKLFKSTLKKENFKPLEVHLPLMDGIEKFFNEDYKNGLESCKAALIKYQKEPDGFEESIILAKKYMALHSAAIDKDFSKQALIMDILNKKDSIYAKMTRDEVNKLHVEMQSEKNIAENNRLNVESILKEKVINEQKKNQKIGISALAIISLLLILLGFQVRRLSKQKNDILNKNKTIQLLHQELNHRVKNNLSFMTSLVEMQGRRTQNIEAREILQETENRLGALSLVHSNLFKNDEATTVNLAFYLEELVSQLEKIFAIPGKELNIICDFTDHHVNAEDAMRLGLIVNELVTNSVKHAFTHVNDPQINIATKLDDTGKLTLEYKDNGPGHTHVSNLAAHQDNAHLGTKLIALLKEQMKDRYTLVC